MIEIKIFFAPPLNDRRSAFRWPYLEQAICRYLDCGGLHNGFIRSKDYRLRGNPHFNSKLKVEEL